MSKNIKSQFHYALNSNFTEGFDKHSYQKENGKGMDEHIQSYQYKSNLLDVARNISNFLKKEYPDIKKIKNIKPEHVQAFLNKRSESCSDNALNQYSNAINKLELVAEKTFRINLKWKGEYIVPPSVKENTLSCRGVKSVISREDLNIITNYAAKVRSQSGDAIRLQGHLGIRVQEIVSIKRDSIDLQNNTLTIENCKGGKELTRELSPGAVELIKDILAQDYNSNKLFSIKSATVNEYLRNIQDKLGLERHSFHDIRRLMAQEIYDKYRENGDCIVQAADKTSVWLNHGHDRNSMLKQSYIVLR